MLTTRKSIFLLSVIILSFVRSILNQVCKNYTCAQIEIGYCERSIIDTNIDEVKYLLQECPHTGFCPWKDGQSLIQCLNVTPADNRAYPGGKCLGNSDCLSNNCLNYNCLGKIAGQVCSTQKDCVFGLACIGNVCTSQKVEGLACKNEAECLNNLTCYAGNCTRFFSISDGIRIGKDVSPYLCKSGFTYDGECLSLANSDIALDGCDPNRPCHYRIVYNNTFISIPNTCECGYNQYKQSNCFRGNLNNTYLDQQISKVKFYLNFTSMCNAEEVRPGICREYLRNDWDLKKKQIFSEKEKIYANNYHRLIDADYCVPKVVFGWDDTPPQPRNGIWSCPIYKCDDIKFDQTTCAYSVNPFNEQGNNVTVYLNNACRSGELCNFQENLTFQNWTSNYTCVQITRPDLKRNKYPGESCRDHDDCRNSKFNETIGYCIEGHCTGMKENNKCDSNEDCEAGLFCNGLYCQKQQSIGGFCIDQYSCQNNLGCLNGTCAALNSQKNGTNLGNTLDSRLCENGIINKNNQCIQISYRKMSPDSNGFVKCNLGQMCNYTTGQWTSYDDSDLIEIPCDCGYNSEGQGYCPLSHDYRKFIII